MMTANNMDAADALAKQYAAPVKVVVANARVNNGNSLYYIKLVFY